MIRLPIGEGRVEQGAKGRRCSSSESPEANMVLDRWARVEQAYQEAIQAVSIQWTHNDARITGL
jgi:hypothetical protein